MANICNLCICMQNCYCQCNCNHINIPKVVVAKLSLNFYFNYNSSWCLLSLNLKFSTNLPIKKTSFRSFYWSHFKDRFVWLSLIYDTCHRDIYSGNFCPGINSHLKRYCISPLLLIWFYSQCVFCSGIIRPVTFVILFISLVSSSHKVICTFVFVFNVEVVSIFRATLTFKVVF